LTFETFNEDYVRRLTEGDSGTGEHFASYFDKVLFLKLRVRLRSAQLIEDVRQETLTRVLVVLRQGEARLFHPHGRPASPDMPILIVQKRKTGTTTSH